MDKETVDVELVPNQLTGSAIPPASKKRTSRSSRNVRVRKSYDRRVYLNRITADNIVKSFKIDVIEINGLDVDFSSGFAFYTWYLENFSRLDSVSTVMALKFRDQYLAFNLNDEEREFVQENIQHKFLFEESYYEKILCSDSDESIPDARHKETYVPPVQPSSPVYCPHSPIHCATTNSEASGDEAATSHPKSRHIDGYQPVSPPYIDTDDDDLASNPEFSSLVDEVRHHLPIKLYNRSCGIHLAGQLADEDYDAMNKKRRELFKSRAGLVKVRERGRTIYVKADSVTNFHRRCDKPILSLEPGDWKIKPSTEGFLSMVVNPTLVAHAHVIAIG